MFLKRFRFGFPVLIILTVFLFLTKPLNAQMMGSYQLQTQASQSDIQKEQSEQDSGQFIYQNLKDKKVSCQNLTNDDFEKLGDYFMAQMLGNTQSHFYMDQRMTQMMGDSANTQMHIALGKRGSGCDTNAPFPSNTPSFTWGMMNGVSNWNGGVNSMMGFGYGMMGLGYGANSGWFWVLPLVVYIVGLIDLILLAFWLWKQINKK